MTSLEERFIRLCKNPISELGVSDEQLREEFGNDISQLEDVINNLLKHHRLSLKRDPKDKKLWYSLVDDEKAVKMEGLNKEQQKVYQQIEMAGDRGIWTRDIKLKTGIQQQTITKAIKILESRNLIKSVQGVHSKTKKLYMLYDLVPSKEITGGIWYTSNEFDHEFIEVLRNFVTRVVGENKKEGISLKSITETVRTSGISKIELTQESISTIVRGLVYDRTLEEIRGPNDRIMAEDEGGLFRASKDAESQYDAFLTEFPCGICPVIDRCSENGVINPQSCVYYTIWLELNADKDFLRPCLNKEDLFYLRLLCDNFNSVIIIFSESSKNSNRSINKKTGASKGSILNTNDSFKKI